MGFSAQVQIERFDLMDSTDLACNTIDIDATPHASSLIEGHRDFGYSLKTALADIIDNSITAGARKVDLRAYTIGDDPWIALADNGSGMTESELIEAMRLGSKNPLDRRQADDLGRFGIGMKSASFSQCRSLTVLTRKNGQISCARWDLDKVAKHNKWLVEIFKNPSNVRGYNLLPETGTVVVWEKLDRLSGGFSDQRQKRTEFMNRGLASAERHLQLVFHRFMSVKRKPLRLLINDRALQPIDPMASSHIATQKDPDEILDLSEGKVRIKCHTLPHHKRMSREEWEQIGGPEGHVKSQGLYVYRGDRLIIAGSWLGLARQEELTKLCRISVDIPNSMDSQWKIDVKKASAQLPPVVRERLRKVLERFIGTSRKTYRRRGQKLVAVDRFPVWSRIQKDGSIFYKPNPEHPSISGFLDTLPESSRDGFHACLKIIGSGLPLAMLHADMHGGVENIETYSAEYEEISEAAIVAVRTLISTGMPGHDVISILCSTEPFMNHRQAIESLVQQIQEGRQQ